MDGEQGLRTRVDCRDCHFAETVERNDGQLPGEVVIKHGRETGHLLRVEYPDA